MFNIALILYFDIPDVIAMYCILVIPSPNVLDFFMTIAMCIVSVFWLSSGVVMQNQMLIFRDS